MDYKHVDYDDITNTRLMKMLKERGEPTSKYKTKPERVAALQELDKKAKAQRPSGAWAWAEEIFRQGFWLAFIVAVVASTIVTVDKFARFGLKWGFISYEMSVRTRQNWPINATVLLVVFLGLRVWLVLKARNQGFLRRLSSIPDEQCTSFRSWLGYLLFSLTSGDVFWLECHGCWEELDPCLDFQNDSEISSPHSQQYYLEASPSRADSVMDSVSKRSTPSVCRSDCQHLMNGLATRLDATQQHNSYLSEHNNALEEHISALVQELFLLSRRPLVMARVRGLRTDEGGQNCAQISTRQPNGVIKIRTSKSSIQGEERWLWHEFLLNFVFGPDSTNYQISKAVLPMINVGLAGENIMIVVDGQTGTGKSYTMFTGPDSIASQVASKVFSLPNISQDKASERDIRFMAIELSKDGTVDLLGRRQVIPVKLGSGHIMSDGAKPKDISELRGLIDTACEKRNVRSNPKNPVSSRGHMICTIAILHADSSNSTITLVDLAGSEQLSETYQDEEYAAEVRFINSSRAAFRDTFSNPKKHSPYASNDLIPFLKDAVARKTKVLLIANISPLCVDAKQSLQTLNFASQVT
ncbi:hypothetical protein KCU78_g1271, partial [Aureobasidium melanogenum]